MKQIFIAAILAISSLAANSVVIDGFDFKNARLVTNTPADLYAWSPKGEVGDDLLWAFRNNNMGKIVNSDVWLVMGGKQFGSDGLVTMIKHSNLGNKSFSYKALFNFSAQERKKKGFGSILIESHINCISRQIFYRNVKVYSGPFMQGAEIKNTSSTDVMAIVMASKPYIDNSPNFCKAWN